MARRTDAATLAELLNRYQSGDVLEHEGTRYVFRRLPPRALDALEARWRERPGGPAPGAASGLPLGGGFAFCMCDGFIEDLIAAAAGCTDEQARALYAARRRETRHLCLCLVLASDVHLRATVLAHAGHPLAEGLAEVIESQIDL